MGLEMKPRTIANSTFGELAEHRNVPEALLDPRPMLVLGVPSDWLVLSNKMILLLCNKIVTFAVL